MALQSDLRTSRVRNTTSSTCTTNLKSTHKTSASHIPTVSLLVPTPHPLAEFANDEHMEGYFEELRSSVMNLTTSAQRSLSLSRLGRRFAGHLLCQCPSALGDASSHSGLTASSSELDGVVDHVD